jgi:glycosyltransferase involved in cell wall biosynthesis
MKLPKISVITTSYTMDRFKDITELLDSIQVQTYDSIEMVFVAERSPELCHKIRAYADEKSYPNVQVLFNQGEWGLSSARNLGIRQASGDIIAFVDDDAILFPDWAEETAKAYAEDSSIIGLTGPILPLWEDKSMSWFPREFYWIFSCTYWDWTEPTEVRNGYGTNISFRREAFDLAGLFSTEIGGIQGKRLHGEEVELSLRMKRKTGGKIVYNPEVKVEHKVYKYRLKSKFIARSSYWIGYTKCMLKRLYPEADKGKNLLSTEHQLLKRIFIKLFPSILKTLFRNPLISWRKLQVTIITVSFVALGYFSYRFQTILSQGESRSSLGAKI